MSKRRHYRMKSFFGPEQLFKVLKEACMPPGRKGGEAPAVSYDFDWLKRRVSITSADKDAGEDALERLILEVDKRADRGLILPGETREVGGAWEIPVGILLQTPDVFVDVIIATLTEMGVKGVKADEDGDGFTVPDTALARAAGYDEIVMGFPLPAYLEVKDMGEV